MSDELWRLFTDGAVPLELLKQRAHNQRWAEQPQQVIPLTAADPDFPAAAAIREVMVDYARSGVFSYGPPAGLSGFRQAVARRLQVQGAQVTPEGVIAVNSAAAGLAMVCRHWLRPGDEAIVADPVDYLFAHTVRGAGGVPVLWPLGRHAPLDLQSLQALVSPRTRLLCLCNPHNPLGRCFRRDELEQLGRFSRERGIRVLSDEVWSDVVYPPVTFTSWLALPPDLAAIGAVVYGFSKGFGLAGLRIGYVAMADPDAAAALLASSDQPSTVEGVATISQVAAEAACGAEAQAWLAAFLEHLRARRDQAVAALDAIPGLSLHPPDATYVLFARLPAGRQSASDPDPDPDPDPEHDHEQGLAQEERRVEALVERLRLRHGVAVVPGSRRWFGPAAVGHVRLCFATAEGLLAEGLRRFVEGLREETGSGPG
jgi:aspartate/methionine/tyrosine aminotransferase